MQEMEHCIRNCDEMRAADCKKMAESPERGFSTRWNVRLLVSRTFSYAFFRKRKLRNRITFIAMKNNTRIINVR